MNDEIWKIIPEFPYYEVSNFGRIRAIARKIEFKIKRDKNGFLTKKNGKEELRIINKKCKLLNPHFYNVKYKSEKGRGSARKIVTVTLRKNNKTYLKSVARLVLQTFIGLPPNKMEACHNDGNPENNNLKNLRWDTHKNNMIDRDNHGKTPIPPIHFGENHPNSKLTLEDIKNIRKAYPELSLFDLSKKYNVAKSTIYSIVKNKTWKETI